MPLLSIAAAPELTSRFRAGESRFPLIEAVLEGRQSGQILVSGREHLLSAAVITKFGFMYVLEEGKDSHFEAALRAELVWPSVIRPRYLLWYSPTPVWQKWLTTGGRQARRRERIRFEFKCLPKEDTASRALSGITFQTMTAELVDRSAQLGVDLTGRFWRSMDDFLSNGFGVCALKEQEVVGLCYSACVAGGVAEIDIVVKEPYRRQAIGRACGERFIADCVKRGIAPGWDCFSENTASVKLAKQLGFEQKVRYPFYSFNIPIGHQEGTP